MNKSLRVVLLVFSAQIAGGTSWAKDPSVELVDKADKAADQFEFIWSGKIGTSKGLLDDQLALQRRLQKLLPNSSIKLDALCTSNLLSAEDRLLLNRSGELLLEFKTAMNGETQSYASWKKQYSDAAANGSPYDIRLSLYEKLVWSRARSRMLITVSTVFDNDYAFHQTRVQNSCAVNRILAEQSPAPDKVKLLALREHLKTELNTPASKFYDFYHETLSIILSMP